MIEIGRSANRVVYACEDPTVAIKIALTDRGQSANLFELEFWNRADAELRRWLAPALEAHQDGAWLKMTKGRQAEPGDVPSSGVPPILRDWRKARNWVWLPDGRLVLCDYAHPRMELPPISG